MALTERQIAARKGKMTASRVGAVMGEDPERIYDLWLELTGDPEWTPPDFSKVWAVQLGNATEQFHLDWIQRSQGPISMRGKSFQHPKVPWALSTLDGWIEDLNIPIEAKHTGGFESMDVVIDRYMPQIHWTMYCTETEECAFSVIMGAKEPKPVIIKRHAGYQAELIRTATEFMEHVFNLTEPVANPYVKPPKPEFSGVIDMSASNSWGAYANRWLEYRPAHIDYEEAAKGIKKLVPATAKEAFGHGVRVKRNSAGSLSIKPENENGTDERTD
jgi:hypothetical protein